jgi:hypothetical protein
MMGRPSIVPVIVTNSDASQAGARFTQQICNQLPSSLRAVAVNVSLVRASPTTRNPWPGPDRRFANPTATSASTDAPGEATARGDEVSEGRSVAIAWPLTVGDGDAANTGALVSVGRAATIVGDGNTVAYRVGAGAGDAVSVAGGSGVFVGVGVGGVHATRDPLGLLPDAQGTANPIRAATASVTMITISVVGRWISPTPIPRFALAAPT